MDPELDQDPELEKILIRIQSMRNRNPASHAVIFWAEMKSLQFNSCGVKD
jgi:hypothetical protein